RLAGDPLVSVQSRERAARTDIYEAGRSIEFAARFCEVKLLRDRCSPAFEEIGSERDDEFCVSETDPRNRNAVSRAIRGHRGFVCLEVDTEMRTHRVCRQPLIDERR